MRPQDIFILSKGHGVLAQYVVLEDLGRISHADMDRYCQPGGRLGAHPDRAPHAGIHASTGSLGHGLGIAAGMAHAERLKGSDVHVYVLLSDGECQEGSTWEAAMVAADLRLDNLTALIDCNDWGGMDNMSGAHHGATSWSLARKFAAFDWTTNTVDGHSSFVVSNACAKQRYGYPVAIPCLTIKGRGVSFIENGQPLWHYRSPNDDEYRQALEEIG